jgi:diguanylate cyclase (GGDEF)-like protein
MGHDQAHHIRYRDEHVLLSVAILLLYQHGFARIGVAAGLSEAELQEQIDAQLQRTSAVRLPPLLGTLYEERLGADRRQRLAMTLILGAGALESAALLNLQHESAVFESTWYPRLAVASLLILCAFVVRRVPPGWREGLAFGVPVVASTVLTTWVGAAAPGNFADRSTMIAVCIIAAFCAVPPLPVITAAVLAAAGFTGFALTLWRMPGMLSPTAELTLLGFGAFALGLAVLMACYREVGRRRAFLHALRHEMTAAELSRTNAELERLMHTDVLTGVANRRRFESDLRAAWPARETEGVGLLLIDVDHFKPFNDCVGHAGGDACLRRIAAAIAGTVRGGAFGMARWGGEEFVVLAPGIPLADLPVLAERVRSTVEQLAVPHPAFADRCVTVSVGAAWCGAETPCEAPDQLMRQADHALYAAKTAGRNRVVVHQAPRVLPAWAGLSAG